MSGTYVLLPIRREVFEEIAEEIRRRGQPDRIEGRIISLADVALIAQPEDRLYKIEEEEKDE